MSILPQELAMAIYNCHSEILRGNELLKEVQKHLDNPRETPLEDVFGHKHSNLELGVPSGDRCRSIVRVSPELGKHIIVAHIASMESKLVELSQAALVRLQSTDR
jgi:hypothetical protein